MYQGALTLAGECRQYAWSKLNRGGRGGLHKVPLTREELIGALRLLDTVDSESAMPVLRDNHAAQVNLASISRGARFKFYFHGGEVLNVGRRTRLSIFCGVLKVAKSIEAVDFLLQLAPGRPLPMSVL